MNDSDPIAEFTNVLEKAGFILPHGVDMDGKRHRVATQGDKDGKTSGVYKAFLDGKPAGWYEDHRDSKGVVKWVYSGGLDADPLARLHLRASAQQNRDDEARSVKAQYAKQAQYAQSYVAKWPQAENNEYLDRKGVAAAPGVRINDKNELIVPFSNSDGETRSYQRIPLTGGKDARILKGSEKSGNWFPLGEPVNGQPILFAEGYATAASIHEGTGLPVLMTIDGGNMVSVAENAHKKWPDSPLLFCADNDYPLEQRAVLRGITDENQIKAQNKGIVSAEAAAKLTGGEIIIPQFTEIERSKELTDFNDLDVSRGREVFREIINTQLHELGISTQFNQKSDKKMGLDNLAPPPAPTENITMNNNGIDTGQINYHSPEPNPIFQDEYPYINSSEWDPQIDLEAYKRYEASLDNNVTLASQSMSAPAAPLTENALAEHPLPVEKTPIVEVAETAAASPDATEQTAPVIDSLAEPPTPVEKMRVPEEPEASQVLASPIAAEQMEPPVVATESTASTPAPEVTEASPATPIAAEQPEPPVAAAESTASAPAPEVTEAAPASPIATEQPETPVAIIENTASTPTPEVTEATPATPIAAEQPEPPVATAENTAGTPAPEVPESTPASPAAAEQPTATTKCTASASVPDASEAIPAIDDQEVSRKKSWGERLDNFLGKFGHATDTEKQPLNELASQPQAAATTEADAIVYAQQRSNGSSAPLENLDELRKSLTWEYDEKKRTTLYKLDEQPSFKDLGNRFEMVDGAGKDDRKVLAALAVATQLYGGVIELTGSDEFKDKAMRLIVEYDLEVRMTSPAQREQLEAIRKEIAGTGDAIVTHQPTPDLNRHTQDSPSPDQPVPPPTTVPASETSQTTSGPAPSETPSQPGASSVPSTPAEETISNVRVAPQEEPAPGKLSPGQSVTAILEDFGQKEYVNGDKKGYSYFVELKNRGGSHIYWGQDLEKLVDGRQPGDVVKLTLDSREKWGMPGEETNRVRNKWSMVLVSPGIAVPHDQPEQGQKLTAFSTDTFLQLNEQIQQGWPEHTQGLKLPAAVDQFLYLREDRHASTQQVNDPKLTPATDELPLHLTPVMASVDKDTQQMNLLLVQSAGDNLQGVARLNGTLYPVLATPTADNQQLVINALTDNGLRFAGYGQAVNGEPGMSNPTGPQLMQFHLKGRPDDEPLSARLYTPEKQPAEMFQRLGFEQTWQQWSDSQKQQDRQEKTLHQEHSPNPGR
ncbi:DNA primase [Salmonella enterica subsp. enterica]|nr:DNA primase [Salmonella enterica subsp. enterica]MIF52475.1 DNA primase [Salmonella enterica subsp. enterica]